MAATLLSGCTHLQPPPEKLFPDAADPAMRIDRANSGARIEPTRDGFFNAVQVYPYSKGALYRTHTAPGQITDIALQGGQRLVGSGPVAAGDTESGTGAAKRIHILVKPTRPDLATNLVVNTDRRTYPLKLRSTPSTTMASVSRQYPQDALVALRQRNADAATAAPVEASIDVAKLRFRYRIMGDDPPWRPISAGRSSMPWATRRPHPASGIGGPVDAAAQRRAQEQDAARLSRLFVSIGPRDGGALSAPEPVAATDRTMPAAIDAAVARNGDDHKLAFADAPTDRRTASPDRLAPPVSPYVVQAGTIIAGALLTGLRSDLPGQITAQVTENVCDSPAGRTLLIPQESRLIGKYDSQVAFGQSRVQLVWTRLILPNGGSVVLERQPGTDAAGYAGLEDGVDNHWGSLFKAALLSTLLSVGAEAGATGDAGGLADALRRGVSQSVSRTGQQVVGRDIVAVAVNRDLVLEPYRE